MIITLISMALGTVVQFVFCEQEFVILNLFLKIKHSLIEVWQNADHHNYNIKVSRIYTKYEILSVTRVKGKM